jgi:hypothetical protein
LSLLDVTNHRLLVHGQAVAVRCAVPQVSARIEHEFGSILVRTFPTGARPICGFIGPYDGSEVRHRLATEATFLGRAVDGVELYRSDDRYWRIDDRRGLVELCTHRNVWRSWLLADGAADSSGAIETGLLWPAAQLLRPRDLFLMPALSVARDGWGLLILCPYQLDRETRALTDAGFELIGQGWVGLREAAGQLSMLPIRDRPRRGVGGLRIAASAMVGPHPGPMQPRRASGKCDAVLIIEAERRPVPRLRTVNSDQAASALRRAWPMTELHPHRRTGRLPSLLARHCGVYQGQLTPDPRHLLRFANAIRFGLADGFAVSAVSLPSAAAIWRPSSAPAISIGSAVRARDNRSAAVAPQRRGLMGRLRKATTPGKVPEPVPAPHAASNAVPDAPPDGATPWSIAG